MANDSNKNINKKIDDLNTSIDNLYQKTYSTRADNKNDLSRINSNINTSVDDLLSKINGQDVSNISSLYVRLQRKENASADDVQTAMEQLVTDNSVMDSINMENTEKYIQSENYQYDLICKYMPKLEDAIEIKKDNVLSADSFTKEFINAKANKSDEDFLQIFSSRAKNIKKKYKVEDMFEDIYYDTAKYGECFVYHVPYKTAFEKLLKRKNAPIKTESSTSKNDISTQMIFESSKLDKELSKQLNSEFVKEDLNNGSKVILKLDPYEIIPEAIVEVGSAMKASSQTNSLNEAYMKEDGTAHYQNNFNMGLSKSTALQYDELAPSDGLTNSNGNPKVKEMSGSVIYKIPRENIIPCYIGDYCIGYYYFNIVNEFVSEQVVTGGQYNTITNTSRIEDTELDKQNDMLIGHIAASLATAIDDKFINSNTDLREEIYAILRYNDKFNAALGVNTVTVSFLPASDVSHFYFKIDKKTHRGISDLKKAVVPAMLYCLLYLTDIISKVSRSQDKRIYYVKQNVETNVSRTLLNVINQIKKGNMGMRQLENMNTIFNVIGKYNDHVIPVGQSGDAPIQFEVMQGQQTETPTDLMANLEDMAVSSTDVPLEFVQSVNQVDYATRFTMSNSKFLRKVFKRQSKCQELFSEIFRKLYNYEYGENEQSISVMLPAPAFLTLTNSQQLIDNTKNFSSAIAEIELGSEDDEVKQSFIKLYMRNSLGSYINYELVDNMITIAKQRANVDASKRAEVDDSQSSGDNSYNDNEF